MRYSPRPCDARAQRLMWAFLAAGSVCFCLTPLWRQGRAVFQLGAVVLMCGGIYIAVRYMLTSFVYEIALKNSADPGDMQTAPAGGGTDVRLLPNSSLDLVVRKASGQRAAVIDACLALDELVYFAPLPREGGREREPYKRYPGMRVYNYTASVAPQAQYMAVFVDGAQNVTGVILEPGAELAEFLSAAAEKNEEVRRGEQ